MKWKMRKIVLLALIVSTLFFSLLLYYVTYPFLFQNKAFFLSKFCLFQLEKHMKELSMVRIIIAGLLLITVLIVCKRIWRQFFYSKKYKKYLSHLLEKGNKYIYCRLWKLQRLQLDYSVRKLSCRKVCFRRFQMKRLMRLFSMKNIIKIIGIR